MYSILNTLTARRPNPIGLRRELPNKTCLDRYKGQRLEHHIFASAAKLWTAGVPLAEATVIVTEAFSAVIVE